MSQAQFRKMGALYQRGEITKSQLEDFNKGVDYASLPARVGKPSKSRRRRLAAMRATR